MNPPEASATAPSGSFPGARTIEAWSRAYRLSRVSRAARRI